MKKGTVGKESKKRHGKDENFVKGFKNSLEKRSKTLEKVLKTFSKKR